MKRQREDPLSYLGGDLADIQVDEDRHLTKAQKNQLRKANNKKWKLTDRKVGSGRDPCPRHTLYYKAQIPELRDEEEWTAFQTALVDPLPVSFRIGGGCPAVVEDTFRKRMANEFNKFSGHYVEVDGRVLTQNIVKRVPWAGHGVWQVSADSATLAKNPGFEVLSGLLRREVALGNIVRQELASMIPALLLRVQSHHRVLDVCAAPGSKTEQLLRLMAGSGGAPCTGMVVANDADPVRINTLKNRYARCLSPHLLITCATAEELAGRIQRPVFDRILADVPCSGDGTIRKFPHIWRLFRPRMSLDLHSVQLSIALASVSLLVPGGRMVYSTCSLNPLEDEAVVSALLQHCWHLGLRLVDTRAEGLLPGLKSRSGLSYWRCDPEVFVVGEGDEALRRESLARLPALAASMSPPSEEDAALLQLQRCHRILPQDNDTGGFFVAVLELRSLDASESVGAEHFRAKVAVASSKKKKSGQAKESVTSVDVMKELGYNPKRKRGVAAAAASTKLTKKEQQRVQQASRKEQDTVIDPPAYRTVPTAELARLVRCLDLRSSLPAGGGEERELRVMRAVQGGDEVLSLVSHRVQEALETWAQGGAVTEASSVGVLVHAGVPVASFSPAQPHLVSLLPDGVPALLPWMKLGENSSAELGSVDFRALAYLRCDAGAGEVVVKAGGSVVQCWLQAAQHQDEALLERCTLSTEGRAVLDALCLSAQERLAEQTEDNGDAVHVVLVLDPAHVSALRQQASSRTATATAGKEGGAKRRLSKMERKRLGQGVPPPLPSQKELEVLGSSGGGEEDVGNVTAAALVLQVRRGGRYRTDFVVSILTKEDVCKSFAASIVG